MATATVTIGCEGSCCCQCYGCNGKGYYSEYDLVCTFSGTPVPAAFPSAGCNCSSFDNTIRLKQVTSGIGIRGAVTLIDTTLSPCRNLGGDTYPDSSHYIEDPCPTASTPANIELYCPCVWVNDSTQSFSLLPCLTSTGTIQNFISTIALVLFPPRQPAWAVFPPPEWGINVLHMDWGYDPSNPLGVKYFMDTGLSDKGHCIFSMDCNGGISPIVSANAYCTACSSSAAFGGGGTTVVVQGVPGVISTGCYMSSMALVPVASSWKQCGQNSDGTTYTGSSSSTAPTFMSTAPTSAKSLPTIPHPDRCSNLGSRTEFRAGCNGWLCNHDCNIGLPALPGIYCQTCEFYDADPDYTDQGPAGWLK